MAYGEIRVTLDAATRRRLVAAADGVGRSIDDYARTLIVDGLEGSDWAEDARIAEQADQTGVTHSVAEGLATFDAAVKTRFSKSG